MDFAITGFLAKSKRKGSSWRKELYQAAYTKDFEVLVYENAEAMKHYVWVPLKDVTESNSKRVNAAENHADAPPAYICRIKRKSIGVEGTRMGQEFTELEGKSVNLFCLYTWGEESVREKTGIVLSRDRHHYEILVRVQD